jgi:protein AFG1
VCFISLWQRTNVPDINIDYRRIPRALSQVYYHPLNSETRSEMDKLFNAITSRSNILTNYRLPIWGKRVLTIPECTINTGSGSEGAGISQSSLNNDGTPNGNGNGDGDIPINVARLSFKELCGDPLSAADYIELTRTFGIIMVTEIGKMGLSEKDLVSLSLFLLSRTVAQFG